MDSVSLQKIKDVIAKSASISVAVGKDPSVDDMAAALSLYLVLSTDGKKVTVACPTGPIVELSSLVGIDKVKNSLSGTSVGDLIVSFPYHEGEIEKVSYTIENDSLNIVVKAGEQGLTFDERDVKYTRGGGSIELLFIVGTTKLSDLGTLFDPESLKDTTIVNIDNKQDNQGFGELVLVSPEMSSVSEQVADLISELGLTLDLDISQNLLTGIAYATENFQSPQTSALAFEMASLLMKNGAVRQLARVSPQHKQTVPLSPFAQQPPARRMPMASPLQPPRQEHPGVNNMQDAQTQQRRQPPADWLTPKVYKGSTDL